MTFLAGYRFDRCQPAAGLADRLVAGFARPTPLGQGADAIAAGEGIPSPEVLVGLYSLLWHQRLRLDLTQPLNSRLGGVGMRRTVQLWDRVRVAGEDWQAVAVAGDMVALKSADGARLETFTQAELLTTAEITTPGRPSAPATNQLRVIEELSAEDRERLQFLQAHILDLLVDAPPGARSARPEQLSTGPCRNGSRRRRPSCRVRAIRSPPGRCGAC